MTVFNSFAQSALEAKVTGQTLKAVLVSSDYAFSVAHQFRSSLAAEQIGTAVTLTSVTTAAGVLDAADPTFLSVAAGEDIAGVAIYIDTGDAATDELIKYDDTPDLAPDGSNVVYAIHSSGLLRL